MSKIKVNLSNCFGIGKLEHEFVFEKHQHVLIYAPNGTMKTSLAKSFEVYSKGGQPKDWVYSERESHASFCEEDGTPLVRESIYVVDPDTFSPAGQSVTAFLASDELKREYDEAFRELDSAKRKFYAELGRVSQSSDCDYELRETFGGDGRQTELEILEGIFKSLFDNGQASPLFGTYMFRYNDIFDMDGKVRKFVQDHLKDIRDYFRVYHSVLGESDFFKNIGDGKVFGTDQADAVLKGLKDTAFFDVGHRVVLNGRETIENYDAFAAKYDDELAQIVGDPKVKKVFDRIDKAIGKNKDLRAFKAAIVAHNEYVAELLDYDGFRRKVWLSFLTQIKGPFQSLIELYREKKPRLDDILRRAGEEQEVWKGIIGIFNDRFHAPFEVQIANQRDVLINGDTAQLTFFYRENRDADREKAIEQSESDLREHVLSKGERRAFSLLQMLFEIEARKRKPLLLVFDDVADSFDYKNKYAIIEYIQDMGRNSNVRTILLTHNFDFYRSIASRLGLDRNVNVFLAAKNPSTREIKLLPGQFLRNLLSYWLQDPNGKVLLAMLPFVRNLVEYIQGPNSQDYYLLTSCLHDVQCHDDKLSITKGILIGQVKDIYRKTLPTIKNLEHFWPQGNIPWVKLLAREAGKIPDELRQGKINETNLENKVILAMATRLSAEAFMFQKLQEQGHIFASRENRFGNMLDAFRMHGLGTASERSVLNKVSLMTPEQIHLNSFMYEPLVDISLQSLIAVYEAVSAWRVAL